MIKPYSVFILLYTYLLGSLAQQYTSTFLLMQLNWFCCQSSRYIHTKVTCIDKILFYNNEIKKKIFILDLFTNKDLEQGINLPLARKMFIKGKIQKNIS